MRILTLVDYYIPGFKGGGALRSVANLVAELGAELEFIIITRDRDIGDDAPYNVAGRVAGAVVYLAPEQLSIRNMERELRRDADVLYLNSFFSVWFSICPLLLRRARRIPRLPVVLAPRGEFGRGAMRIRGGRKRAYVMAARLSGALRGILWQASSAAEAADIRRVVGAGERIVIAPDVPARLEAVPPRPPEAMKQSGRLRLVLLSRISRMKNLDGALHILAGVRHPVDFDIYGPREDSAYWNECETLIQRLPEHVRVSYCGSVPPAEVAVTLARYDALFLPTKGENFGHVILEALGAGCPAILSDRTEWKELELAEAGWVCSLEDTHAFRAVLDRLAMMDDSEHARWRAGSASHARLIRSRSDAVRLSRELLRSAASRPGSETRVSHAATGPSDSRA